MQGLTPKQFAVFFSILINHDPRKSEKLLAFIENERRKWRYRIFASRFRRETDSYLVQKLRQNMGSRRVMKRPDWMQKTLEIGKSEFELDINSIHGLAHWERVERFAMAICETTEGSDIVVCRLFGILHDTKRINDGYDPDHGHRSGSFAERLFRQKVLDISLSQLHLLVEACRYHNDGGVSNDPTIGACWDADRLDLPRVKIKTLPRFLSTEAAKSLLPKKI